MIKSTEKEDAGLPTPSSHLPLGCVKVRTGHKLHVRLQRRTAANPQSPDRIKFQKAFSSALHHRSAFLGRRLTRQEWCKLKKAVQKQVFDKPDSISRQLRLLATEVAQLRAFHPATPVVDSLAVMELKLDALRQQAVSVMQERDSVSETCPHFRKRTLFYSPDLGKVVHFEKIPGIRGSFSYKIQGQLEQLCCPQCLLEREDCYFSWTGDSISFSSATGAERLVEKGRSSLLLSISPLSIQSIWTQLCSLQIREILK